MKKKRESCKFFDTDETSRLISFDKFYQFQDNLIQFEYVAHAGYILSQVR